jgi:Amt family ammonium transporter
VASIVFELVCIAFLKLKIDDPLCAAPMHGFAGMWGLLCVGFLANNEFAFEAYGGNHPDSTGNLYNPAAYPYGAFYPGGGGKLLACQVWNGVE